jgi:Gas vesicle synthesis protein GvpO
MANSDNNGSLSAVELARAALTAVEELTGYRPEAATALEWDGDSDTWRVTVEMLELARVPNTTDVIGAYEVRLDGEGGLHGYRRLRRYTRAEPRED